MTAGLDNYEECLESIIQAMDDWLDDNDGGWEYFHPDWCNVCDAMWYLKGEGDDSR